MLRLGLPVVRGQRVAGFPGLPRQVFLDPCEEDERSEASPQRSHSAATAAHSSAAAGAEPSQPPPSGHDSNRVGAGKGDQPQREQQTQQQGGQGGSAAAMTDAVRRDLFRWAWLMLRALASPACAKTPRALRLAHFIDQAPSVTAVLAPHTAATPTVSPPQTFIAALRRRDHFDSLGRPDAASCARGADPRRQSLSLIYRQARADADAAASAGTATNAPRERGSSGGGAGAAACKGEAEAGTPPLARLPLPASVNAARGGGAVEEADGAVTSAAWTPERAMLPLTSPVLANAGAGWAVQHNTCSR